MVQVVMTNGGLDRPLILPPRSDDIFDRDYHPDIAAQAERQFQAYKKAGVGSYHREPKSRKEANLIAVKFAGLFFLGVPIGSFIIYKFVMFLGH